MDIPVPRSRYNYTRLAQHSLQHSLMRHTVAPDSLAVKDQMVNGQWRVALLQLATVLTMVGYGACHTTIITWCEMTRTVRTTLLAYYKANIAATQANQSIFGLQLHKRLRRTPSKLFIPLSKALLHSSG